jgi:hypothetical protein
VDVEQRTVSSCQEVLHISIHHLLYQLGGGVGSNGYMMFWWVGANGCMILVDRSQRVQGHKVVVVSQSKSSNVWI